MREEEKEIENRIREALKKDFHKLYVKEFTTSWQEERIVRDIDIGVMDIEHLKDFISQALQAQRAELLEKLPKEKKLYDCIGEKYSEWNACLSEVKKIIG